MTFVHKFQSGAQCVVTVSDKPPEPGENHFQKYEWIGKPDPSVVPEYTRWIHEIQSHLAQLWGMSIMHVFLLPEGKQEAWLYNPDQPPELVQA